MINKKYRDIFKLNSFQPYIHGVWKNDKVSIGNEEALEGRNKLIIDQFEKIISKSFSTDEIKKLRLIDIGSYDGHLSIEIEKKFPFKEIVSLEPRKKNFEKGKFIREYLNVNTKVKFLNGNLEDVKDKFDIVFCVGVLHHLDNINLFIKNLSKICSKSMYIETLSYNSKNKFFDYFLEKLNKKIIEPKDVIYKFKEKTVGITGHKLETNYNDGSTLADISVVSVPDNEFLKQVLYVNNFKSKILISGEEYYKFIKSNFRNFSASIIYAERESDEGLNKIKIKFIKDYEKNYLIKFLPAKKLKLVKNYNFLYKFLLFFLNKKNFEYELFFNLKYNFKDKLNFEEAKNLLKNGEIFKGTRVLYKIISKYNSDYRTCYRAFAILAYIYRKKESKKKFFINLLTNCHADYPTEIVDELETIYNKI